MAILLINRCDAFLSPSAFPTYDTTPQIADGTEKAVRRRCLRVNQTVQAEAVLERQHDCGGPCRIQRAALAIVLQRGLNDVGDQLAPSAQALGQLWPALLGASHVQYHLHMKERRAAEWILPAAVHDLQCRNEIIKVGMLREQVEIAPY